MTDVTSQVDEMATGRFVETKSKRIKLTSTQVLALNATPVELVAAPGADKMLEFVGAVVHKPAGTAYADVHTDDDIEIRYTNASGAQVNTLLECTGFVDQTTAQTRITRPIVTEYTPVANAALVAHMKTGEITTGNSPLYITIVYRVYQNVVDDPST